MSINIKTFVFALLLSSNLYAANYYVATTGNDSNAGTIGSPFLTLQKCADVATTPDDYCYVGDGTYTSGFLVNSINGSAEAEKNITNISKGTTTTITVAGHGYSNGDKIKIGGLTNYLTTGMQQLFNKWFLVANAATNTFEITDFDGNAVDSSTYDNYVAGGTVSRIHPIIFKATNRNQVTIDKSYSVGTWTNSGQPANVYESAVVSLPASGTEVLWRTDQTRVYTRRTSKAACTAEGDFYYDSSVSKFYLYTTINPNSYTYKGFKRGASTSISINGSSYIMLDGFNIQYGADIISIGSTLAATNNIVLNYIRSRYSFYHGAIFGLGGDTYQLKDITIDHADLLYAWDNGTGIDANGYAIKMGGNSNTSNMKNLVVSNSTIGETYCHGIQFSNGITSGYFYNNRIYGYSLQSSGACAGIRTGLGETNNLSNKDTQIFDNNIGNGTGGTGYSIGCSVFIQDDNRGTTLFRNQFHHNTWHGVYVFYSSGAQAPSNILAFNNLFYENKTAGLRSDNSYGGVNGNNKVHNNSFYNNGESSIAGVGAALSFPQNYSDGFAIRNNIIYSGSAYAIYSSTPASLSTHIYPSDYNVFYPFKVYWNGTTYTSKTAFSEASSASYPSNGFDYNSVIGDPLYASPSTGDFRIPSPTTPADSIGTDLSASIPTDYEVNTRQVPFDVGAYNTQGNLVVAPSIALSSYFPGRVGTATFGFTTSALTINNNYKIVLTFPAGFTISSGGTTVVSASSGFDGTFSTSVAGQVVTVTRNGDGTNTSPSTFSITLNFIKNTVDSGQTGTFGIAVHDNSDVEVGVANSIAGVIISSIAPDTLEGLTISGARI